MKMMIYEFTCTRDGCGKTFETPIMGPIGKDAGCACLFCRGQANRTSQRGRSVGSTTKAMGKRFETVRFAGWLGGPDKNLPKVHRQGALHGQTFSLAHTSNRNPSGALAWGDESPGSANLARAIMFEVAGQEAADKYGKWFLQDVIARLPADQPFEMPASLVREWLGTFNAGHEHADSCFAAQERQCIEAQLTREIEDHAREAAAIREEDERDWTAERRAGIQGV